MKKLDLEFVVGLFMVAGIACLGWLSIRLGSLEVFPVGRYPLTARFAECGGLKTGSRVVIAGVEVGRVERITLKNYEANVRLLIDRGVEIREDAIASIRTRGLIGEQYITLSMGGADTILKPGDEIRETEPAIDLVSLLSKYIFSAQPGGK